MTHGMLITTKGNSITVWGHVHNTREFCEFMQWAIDGSTKASAFLLIDCETEKVYDAYAIATNKYNMRKRTFDERINDVKTYCIKEE